MLDYTKIIWEFFTENVFKFVKKIKYSLRNNIFSTIFFIIVSSGIIGYVLIYNLFLGLILLGILLWVIWSIYNEFGSIDIHLVIISSLMIVMVGALFFVANLERKPQDEKIIQTIIKPQFTTTSTENIIFQKDNPSKQISVSAKEFVVLKNSNCKYIDSIEYNNRIINGDDFWDTYITKNKCIKE